MGHIYTPFQNDEIDLKQINLIRIGYNPNML